MDEDDDGGSMQSEDDMVVEAFTESKNKLKPYEVPHEPLSQTQVEKLMQQDVDHICGILGVDTPTSALLLRQAAWNKERLIEQYMDNPTKVLVSAGVQLPEAPSTSSAAPIRSSSSSARTAKPTRRTTSTKPKAPLPFVCPICFDDAPDIQTKALACQQTYCSNCWSAYVNSKVRDEGEHTIPCMGEGCSLVAPDTFVHSVLIPGGPTTMDAAEQEENSATWSRYQQLIIRHFVASNGNLKYCPYPECTNTVSCPSASSKSSLLTVVPIVSCGARGVPGQQQERASQLGISPKEHIFCFGCPVESDHRPLVCAVARLWLQKCHDDSETANWIKTNTKECSKCQSTIEKNGGCNHMTCKKCKWEFCWVCMGPWTEHGTSWYSCNRYDEKAGIDARDAQSRSRASLERYLHYYNRWANHEQSAKLSLELYVKTEKKMEDMQITSDLTWIEVQFMKKAVEEVDKCRQTLKWTYAMAYYLSKGNEKDLFEDNQSDLEKAVEDLSELLEQPIEPENIAMLRQKVTDKTVYVAKRNDIVLEDTALGYQDGRWKWNVDVEGFETGERIDY
ncbi:hypothetical protein BD626DRAFT_544688 [Schizophyllum amplum]|uniref:RBR-type E3 ubiquitin transferase n=1 Tax=Schizophyllum amplum TaxID=97359 RepID=A0A550CZM0_9AGAR|nr:hypothetical protein BD626DRAFT_544688 [Auriculariopsis ampla]